MIHFNRIFLILVLSFFRLVVHGQYYTVDFKKINESNGLSSNYVNCILQDSKGYLWIGTRDGLNRYDGYGFKIYKPLYRDTTSLPSAFITTLFEDHNQVLWIGTEGGGLAKYNRTKDNFTSVSFSDKSHSIPDNNIRFIYEDSHRNFWIALYRNGLLKLDRNTGAYQQFNENETGQQHIISNVALSMLQRKDGTLWVLTHDGLCSFNYEKGVFQKIENYSLRGKTFNSNTHTKMLEDNEGNVWIGVERNGLLVYRKNKKIFQEYSFKKGNVFGIPNAEIQTVFQDSKQNIWIGSINGGLQLYDKQRDLFYSYVHDDDNENSLGSNSIHEIFEDKSGNIWLCTHGDGLNYFNIKIKRFSLYRHKPTDPNSLNYKIVSSFLETPTGDVWVGTDGGGLNLFHHNTKAFTHFTSKNGLSSDLVLDLERNDDDSFWIATWDGGINLLNTKTKKVIQYPKGRGQKLSLSHQNTKGIKKDKFGRLWIATHGDGINIFDLKRRESYSGSENLLNLNLSFPQWATDVIEDSYGDIWVTTYAGLFRYSSGKLYSYLANDKDDNAIMSSYTYCAYEDRERRIWIGTNKGLDLYMRKNDSFKHISNEYGFQQSIKAVLEDDHGNLWMSSNNGLIKFNLINKSVRLYGIEDGLQGNEFLERASLKTTKGELYFGGINGFNVFHPDSVQDNTYIPPVIITDLQIFNKSQKPNEKNSPLIDDISETKEIELKYSQSIFSLSFVAINFINAQKNQYAYMLKGFDKDWHFVGNERKATYTNLDPGHYEFLVKAANNDGVWNDTPTTISIVIIPPFYKTTWFKVFCTLIILSFLYFVYRLRTNYLKRQRTALKRLVNEKTTEIELQKDELQDKNKELLLQQDEIISQRNNLEVLAVKVQEANQKRTNFFTNISHELRTSLTLVVGPVRDLLNVESLASRERKSIELINRNASRLLRLVNQLLDIRKIESDSFFLNLIQADIKPFIRQIKESFDQIAKNKNITFEFISHDIEIRAYYDPDLIDKIIFNLLSNAFKFTKEYGRITLKVSRIHEENVKSLMLKNYPKLIVGGRFLEIRVSDNGQGIPSKSLDKIFDRYFQLESDTPIPGAGIGLALVKDIVRQNYGVISVHSELNQGTEFTICLPIDIDFFTKNGISNVSIENESSIIDNTVITEDYETVEYEGNAAHVSRLDHILVVEDNNELRRYLSEALSEIAPIKTAPNGKVALEMINSSAPIFILSDIMMPEFDGIALCAEIKSNIITSHIPVILLTARTMPEQQLEGLRHGADDYVLKPFDKEALFLKVKNILQTRQRLKERFSKDAFLQPEEITNSSEDEKLMVRFKKVIEDNISNSELDVPFIVSAIGLSRSLLYVKIKELTNMSVNDFIQTMRLKKAASILKNTDKRISEVAYETGFSDPRYFSKCFRKQFGKTPREFKEENF